MSKAASILFLSIGLLATAVQDGVAGECQPAATLVSAQGAVEFKTRGTADWRPARLEQGLCNGDSMRTGPRGRAALRMVNETVVRLDESTTLTLKQVAPPERSLLDLPIGALYFISRVPTGLEVDTPYVNASVEGTEFIVRVDRDSTLVTVFNGAVLARNAAGSVSLTASESALARAGRGHPREPDRCTGRHQRHRARRTG